MKHSPKKAQGSIEFLMTYGWALILVLIVGVVAWKWGLFSFSSAVQPGSYGFWGVVPVDNKMASNGVLSLSIENDAGVNVTVNNIKTTGEVNKTVSVMGVIEPGKRLPRVDINGLKSGDHGTRFDIFIIINYSNSKMQPNEERISSGSIWGSYE